ncbi:hypothetical protein Tco_0558408 [Tanacetum coccineum]
MTSFDYRYAIKECSSCRALYTRNCGCSKGSLEDKILVPVPDSSQRPLIFEKFCLNCGDPVHGYCRQCALIRKTLEEVSQDFQDTSESSDDDTNFVNENQEPFVVNQDPGKNSSQSPPDINHCCYGCGDSLDDIFCQRCTCESCGKGAHYGYNCPPQVLIISNPEPCNNQTVNEFPQTLPSVRPHPVPNYVNSFTYDSKPNFVDDSPNVFNPPPQPPMYSCEFCGNDARYGHYCTPQVPFIYPEPFDQFLPQPLLVIDPTPLENKVWKNYELLFKLGVIIFDKRKEKKKCGSAEEQASKDQYWKIPICYDDEEDYTIAITPVSSTKEPVNSQSMGDEHLDTIPATESDEVIKSSVENLVLILSESEGYFLTAFLFFDDDHIEEKSSGSTTTHADFSQYESFIFDLSINPFPPADRSDLYHEEFTGELAHIISPPEYDHFCFKIKPKLGNLTMDVVEDIFLTREPRVYVPNVLPTHPTLNLDLDFILFSDSLFAYIVWIFLPFLTYPVAPPYLLSCGNKDTIFDPDIPIHHSFMPGISHRSGTFMKFNDCPDSEASRAHGFVLRSQELHILSFIWEIQYLNLID